MCRSTTPEDDAGWDGQGIDTASVFGQLPLYAFAFDGPQLRVAGWSRVAGELTGPAFGGLGVSALESEWLSGTGTQELLKRVYETGQAFSSTDWRIAIPTESGELIEIFVDFTFTPWHAEDGSIRGVIATGTNITQSTSRRLAAQAESASWRERFETNRNALIALQAALLPPNVPVVPGLQLGARYLLTERESAAGGDWFSAYPTRSGRVALIVGDVVGHGVAASATMGQLRAVVKERLLSGVSVTEALQALDAYAATLPGADAATVCAVLIDPATGEAEYCTAGHPPPLIVDEDGWRYLEPTGAGPLGSGRGFATATVTVPADGLLLLYSDGLIERPGVERSASTIEIGEVVANALHGRPLSVGAPSHVPDRVCEQSLELLTRASGFTDDITILAAHRTRPAAELSVRLAAEPGVIGATVAELERWLAAVDAGDSDQLHLRHALVEVVTNSIEHGMTGRTNGIVSVTAHLTAAGEAVIDITDDGLWEQPLPPALDAAPNGALRGLGLPLAAQLVDSMTVEHDESGDSGTHVRLRHRLSRPAPLINTATAASGPGVPSFDGELTITADADRADTIHVHGPVLSENAGRLRTRLDIETRGGTRSLIVNLDDVTHLTSVGVRILQQVERKGRDQDARVALSARPGSVAHEILSISGML